MAVYGDLLAHFPELLEDHEIFTMKPNLGAGYGPRENRRRVVGYWSWAKSGKMGMDGGNRVENHQAVFYVADDPVRGAIIGQNDCVEVAGDVYVVVEDDEFSREAGFTVCPMQKVAVFTDQQAPDREVNLGDADFR